MTYAGNPWKEVKKLSTTFFFTNYPPHWKEKELWNFFSKFRKVVDVYVARKLNKEHKKFGFVRFFKVSDEEELESRLRNIWIGSHKLFVRVEKFKRRTTNGSSEKKSITSIRKEEKKMEFSYAEVLNGKKSVSTPVLPKISLWSKDNSETVKELESHHVGKVRSIHVLNNLIDLCNLDGWGKVKFKYLGGLWVLIQWPESVDKDKFSKLTELGSWFSIIKPWSLGFFVEERIVWLKIDGVPAKVWNPNSFILLTAKWGDVLISEPHWNDNTNPRRGNVCILTKRLNPISSYEEILVDGKLVIIKISEGEEMIPNWEIDSGILNQEKDVQDEDDSDSEDFSQESEEEEGEFVPDSFETKETNSPVAEERWSESFPARVTDLDGGQKLSTPDKVRNIHSHLSRGEEKCPSFDYAKVTFLGERLMENDKNMELSGILGNLSATKEKIEIGDGLDQTKNLSPNNSGSPRKNEAQRGISSNEKSEKSLEEAQNNGLSNSDKSFNSPSSTIKPIINPPKMIKLSSLVPNRKEGTIKKGKNRTFSGDEGIEKRDRFKNNDPIMEVTDSEILRCNLRNFNCPGVSKSTESSSSRLFDPETEIEKTIEVGVMLGFDMKDMQKEVEKTVLGKGVCSVP